jgi:hypothetical protein
MGVQTSNGERTILYVGDSPPQSGSRPERTTDDHLRHGRNLLLGLGGLAGGGNGAVALIKTIEHVPVGDSLGVATRVGAMMVAGGVVLEGVRHLLKRG